MKKKEFCLSAFITARAARWPRRCSTKCAANFLKRIAPGLEPGVLNPLAVEVLQEIGIDISQNKTQAVFDIFVSGQLFLFVITVCSETEAKGCPIFPGVTTRLHWPFPDPSKLTGTWEEKLEGTRKILKEIEEKVQQFCDEQCVAELQP